MAEIAIPAKCVGLARIVAATLYDGVLTLAVLFVATVAWLPFTAGHAIQPNNPLYQAYLVGVWFALHGWCWTHGGQTLGLRAWKLRLHSADGRNVTWRQAALRFFGAWLSWGVFGIGMFWVWVPPVHRAWHDRWSGTYLDWAD